MQKRRTGIDEERHIIRNDLDNRMIGFPALFLKAGIIDADKRIARLVILCKIPQRQRRTIHLIQVHLGQIVPADMFIILPDKLFGLGCFLSAGSFIDQRQQFIHAVRFAIFIAESHLHSPVHLRQALKSPAFEIRLPHSQYE